MGGCVACLGSGNVQGDTAEVVTTALYWLSNILCSFHVYNDFFFLGLLVLNSSFLFFIFTIPAILLKSLCIRFSSYQH